MIELGFREINRHKLKFAVDVQCDSGLRLFGLMGFEDDGKRWINPPSSPVLVDDVYVTGKFGGNKVFISHVWQALRDDPAFAKMGVDEFKRRLAEANNARLLDLTRADMVEAMAPEDVRLSEVPYLGATFHFVRI